MSASPWDSVLVAAEGMEIEVFKSNYLNISSIISLY